MLSWWAEGKGAKMGMVTVNYSKKCSPLFVIFLFSYFIRPNLSLSTSVCIFLLFMGV